MWIRRCVRQLSVLMLVSVLWVGNCVPVQAQQRIENHVIKQLKLDHIDVREAIRQTMRIVDGPYAITADVQGTVTADLENVTVGRALQQILGPLGATYRMESGIFRIQMRGVEYLDLALEQSKTDHFEFNQADVRDAVGQVCKEFKMQCVFDPGVQGLVTMTLGNVSFETALENALRQVDATYRLQNGVILVFPRLHSIGITEPDPSEHGLVMVDSTTTNCSMTQDSRYLYLYKGTTLYKIQKDDLNLVKASISFDALNLPSSQSVSGIGVDVRAALRSLFKRINVSFEMTPEVQGAVTDVPATTPFETALLKILGQVNATYRIDSSAFHIYLKSQTINPGPDPASAMAQDDRYVYLLKGIGLYKFQKSDLTLVKVGSLVETVGNHSVK